uniref:MAGE domain-containing protein n=1 Tax=Sciurus vulgaris TaxID=55149 RepID=A0A8D2DV12_SCIVU
PQITEKRRLQVIWEVLRGAHHESVPRGLQVPADEEKEATVTSSFSTLIPTTPREVPAAGPLICPQSPQRASSPPIAMAPNSWSQPIEGSSSQREEDPFPWHHLEERESLLRNALDEKMADLVQFLLLKYRMRELTTKAEMLNSVIKNYGEHFSVIFGVATECMQLVFGIDVKEVDPSGHTYAIVNALDLTYDGMLGDDQSMPKTGLLIIILFVIFMEGNSANEEIVWEALSVMGVYAGREHFIYGNPRKLVIEDLVQEQYLEYRQVPGSDPACYEFLWGPRPRKFVTEDLVQEQYLEYRQVPGSDPACYEFLWGPRAHAETSKMKVLQYWAQVHGSDPRSYPSLYEKAMREEEEGAQVPKVARATRRGRGRVRSRRHGRAASRSLHSLM